MAAHDFLDKLKDLIKDFMDFDGKKAYEVLNFKEDLSNKLAEHYMKLIDTASRNLNFLYKCRSELGKTEPENLRSINEYLSKLKAMIYSNVEEIIPIIKIMSFYESIVAITSKVILDLSNPIVCEIKIGDKHYGKSYLKYKSIRSNVNIFVFRNKIFVSRSTKSSLISW